MLDSVKHKANMMQSANSLHETHEASLKDKVGHWPSRSSEQDWYAD